MLDEQSNNRRIVTDFDVFRLQGTEESLRSVVVHPRTNLAWQGSSLTTHADDLSDATWSGVLLEPSLISIATPDLSNIRTISGGAFSKFQFS